MSIKNTLTPAGIEPATFRFVTQHLNHCAPAVPFSTVSKCILINYAMPSLFARALYWIFLYLFKVLFPICLGLCSAIMREITDIQV